MSLDDEERGSLNHSLLMDSSIVVVHLSSLGFTVCVVHSFLVVRFLTRRRTLNYKASRLPFDFDLGAWSAQKSSRKIPSRLQMMLFKYVRAE